MLIVSIVVAGVLSLVALLHFYWAFGGLYGIHSAAPQLEGKQDFVPSRMIIFTVACLISSLAVLAVLLQMLSFPFKEWLVYIGYLVSFVFIARAIGDFRYVGFFKKVYNSRFAKKDTVYFSPLCLLLGLAFAALSMHGA